ncbi:MAG: class I SAM-dependent methyltransferase [Flavobacteriales bacterium]|nr:class I SAM-dependent methyltransferase [Flavobacteriales bacterium]
MKSIVRKKLTRWITGSGKLSPEVVSRYYDSWHDRYMNSFGDILQAARLKTDEELMQRVVDECNLVPGMQVLDAGCGVGGPAILLAQLSGVEVEAITVSPVQAKKARKLVEEKGVQKLVNITEGDFHRLPDYYDNGCFDVVVYLETISHSHDWDLLFSKTREVLKAGGTLFVKDFFAMQDENPEINEQIRVATVNTNRYCRLKIREESELIETAERFGFELQKRSDLNEIISHDIGRGFTQNNDVDVYEGGEAIAYLDWAELTFVKK